MAVEARRGCGYRKVGGIYLVGSGQGEACCKLPIPVHVCPTCNQGIKQARGFQWITPQPWLRDPCFGGVACCPAANPERFGEKVGLIWIGEKFYATPQAFMEEAHRLGISRRIAAVPREFKLGETWVFLAHPKAVHTGEGLRPGVIHIFRPRAIEKIVTASEAEDDAAMEKLRKQHVTPVVVPDDDPDHQASGNDEELSAAAIADAIDRVDP